jgi:FtsP/CotA-like multicopper oxidase with cupredoxin domain
VNGAIKCQQVSGGDGFATMADGSQTYLFSFGPLSGLADIANGLPGTEFPNVFNMPYASTPLPGDPYTTGLASFNYNGAIGLAPDLDQISAGACASPCLDGHVDPRQIMDVAVMNGNIPAPLVAIDEDDELFLTLTNVGMIMRPDLFEQHTIHFHGYPNASSFYDGVPDTSVAINIGGSFTYYYLSPDAGTYFWHCHISPPEHLQMGMVGQLYVRPRQNRVPVNNSLYTALQMQNGLGAATGPDLRTVCNPAVDILCSTNTPPSDNGAKQAIDLLTNAPYKYAYNDGDGSTAYDVEYPLQIHGFDPNFHFVGMTFNPENFATMKDKYFLLNGRSYPDTVNPGAMSTETTDGNKHFSQPLPALINIPAGGKALLRISDLDVTEYQTLATLGIPMRVVGWNAKLLRDQAGNNMSYKTNSITLAGGESADVILDASNTTLYPKGSVFYLYTTNLDHLSNDAENFGGLMTEVHIN